MFILDWKPRIPHLFTENAPQFPLLDVDKNFIYFFFFAVHEIVNNATYFRNHLGQSFCFTDEEGPENEMNFPKPQG